MCALGLPKGRASSVPDAGARAGSWQPAHLSTIWLPSEPAAGSVGVRWRRRECPGCATD